MLHKFFQRLKILIVVGLFVSVALPSVSHAFEMKSEVGHIEATVSMGDHGHSQSGHDHQKNADHISDGCDCCHSGCCHLKTVSKFSASFFSADMESIVFPYVSEFLAGTFGSNLFRPPKFVV